MRTSDQRCKMKPRLVWYPRDQLKVLKEVESNELCQRLLRIKKDENWKIIHLEFSNVKITGDLDKSNSGVAV